MKSISLSVVLATFNEASNINRCLTSVKPIADEIIVVDGSSQDKTRQLAQQLGAKIFQTTNKPNFHINKQLAINHAKSDWILQLDADEVVTPKLSREIITTINSNPEANAFYINRKNFFLGRFLTKGGQYPDPVIRLFKRGKAKLPQIDVHEQMLVQGKIGTLKEPMEHFTAPTFARYLQNSNRYTSFTASQLLNKNLPINLVNTIRFTIIKPIVTFLKIYVRHKGFIDGFPGLIFALFSGLHHPISYFKYWELKHS